MANKLKVLSYVSNSFRDFAIAMPDQLFLESWKNYKNLVKDSSKRKQLLAKGKENQLCAYFHQQKSFSQELVTL